MINFLRMPKSLLHFLIPDYDSTQRNFPRIRYVRNTSVKMATRRTEKSYCSTAM